MKHLIFAPGTNIYSTLPGGSYDYMDGTSMAAPVVTGIVGLILAHHGPSAAKNMKARLLSTSRRMEGTGAVSSNGLIDAYAVIIGQTSFNYVWKLE